MTAKDDANNTDEAPSHELNTENPPQLLFDGLPLPSGFRPYPGESLASVVKSIYAGLEMLEYRCAQPATSTDTELAAEDWQAFTALHYALLQHHLDFYVATQHPSAFPEFGGLAEKYWMPERMWKYGIHSFLELLRKHRPNSIKYMREFLDLAYQMLEELNRKTPAFEDTWMECLGDLGRYWLQIGEGNLKEREKWAKVARTWYTKVVDKNPTVGRLYHHLAILACPDDLQQMFYFSLSLTSDKPFPKARESLMTFLDPILGRIPATHPHALPIYIDFIKAHGLQFEGVSTENGLPSEEFLIAKSKFTDNLDNLIGLATTQWAEQGVYIAVTNISGLFDYGKDDNVLRQAFLTQPQRDALNSPRNTTEDNIQTASPGDPKLLLISVDELPDAIQELTKQRTFINAMLMINDTFALVLQRIGDQNVLPYVHIMLTFLSSFATKPWVSNLLDDAPWSELAAFLNALAKTKCHIQIQSPNQTETTDTLLAGGVFPGEGERGDELPLPEDYRVRGLMWTQDYFPEKWFEGEHDEEERYLELESTEKNRMERVLRLGYALSKYDRWITYAKDSHTFKVRSL